MVSVIIPIYNVASFLRDCIKAVLSQTYSELEIILVDDGSDDGSEKICDEFARIDSRINVIHQPNGGLSAARNSGIEQAHGRYISFIDSDDVPDQRMIEMMLNKIIQFDLDVVCCGFSTEEDLLYSKKHTESDGNIRFESYSNIEAISHLLDNSGYRCFAWNKIYKKELFEDIRYPVGKKFEDISTTYKIFSNANRVGFIDVPLYYYRQRENSITKAKFSAGNYDLVEALDYVINDVSTRYKTIYDKVLPGYSVYYIGFIRKGLLSGAEKAIIKEVSRFRKITKRNIIKILFSNSIDKRNKIEIIALLMSPFIYFRLYHIRNYILQGRTINE